MNFPPNLFNSSQYKIMLYNIDTISHNNLNINDELEFHQNLAKKLLKNISTSENLQISVFSYLSKMSINELIKICSINSKWFIDIVHQLILFSRLESQLLKFLDEKSNNMNNDNINENIILEGNNQFTNYFETKENKFIPLSKKKPENTSIDFIQSIRYLTVNLNNEKKQYNNILTLSSDFLSNFAIFKDTFLKISKEECFKFPIRIIPNDNNKNNFNKTIYNFELPQWFNKKETFSVSELICAYFEQIILLHYQYYLLYNIKIIPFPFQNKLDEILDNKQKILSFIDNTLEKNKLFSELNFTSLSKLIDEDKNINETIIKRSNNDKHFSYYFENEKGKLITKTTIEQINDSQFKLHKCFFESNIKFVNFLYETNDNIVGTIEDFVFKSICEQINNIYSQEIANDLINDNFENEEKIIKKKKKKNRKKKHHKKKKHPKEEEKNDKNIENNKSVIEDNYINDINHIELKIENENKNEIIEKNIINDNLNDKTEKEKNKNEDKLKEEINKSENAINENLVENKNKDNNIKDQNDLNCNSNGGKNTSNITEDIIIINPKPKKRKKEKPFFLFPVVKSKKNNEINSDSEKNKKEKLKDNKNNFENKKENLDKKIQNKNLSPETKNIANQNINKDNNNKSYSPSYSQSTKNSFSNNNSPVFQNKQNDYSYKSNNNYNNNINNYFISNYNNYGQKIYQKNYFYQNTLFNPLTYISNSLNQFSNEIKENTKNVNYNKELLSKYRIKYIEEIKLIITSILKNNNNNFSISQYGSYISGLSIENSDVDIMIKLYDKSNVNDIISILIREFTNKDNKIFFSKINPIYTASVPVIKLECEIYDSITDNKIKDYFMNNYIYNYSEIQKLKFDITFFEIDEKEKNNKLPSEKILDFIHENIILYPSIIDIIYIMKRYIQAEKLNLSYKGGISSYSLFLLILSYVKANKNNLKIPIGTLFIEFLTFYANLNFGNYIINPKFEEKNEIYEISSEPNENYIIYIKDPFSGLNVSKSSFKVREIQFAFSKAASYIFNKLYLNNLEKNTESYNKILSGLLS